MPNKARSAIGVEHVLDSRGYKIPANAALSGKVVALLFGASWSPPACDFVAKLRTFYHAAKAEALK